MTDLVEVRRGAYYDSVSLMQVSRAVGQTEGVDAALVAMATELNTGLLAGMGFTLAEEAGPNDLLVAIRGVDDAAVKAGQDALDAALAALKAAGAKAGSSATPRRHAPSAPPRPPRTPTWRSSRCPAATPSSRPSTPSTPGCR